MRTLLTLLAALAVLMSPTAARAQDDDTGTVTIRLELRGDVPAGERFLVDIDCVPPIPGRGDQDGRLPLCGFEPDDPSFAPGTEIPPDFPACESGGTYSRDFEARNGTRYEFAFTRGITNPEVFHEGTVTAQGDTVIGAWYDFGGGDDEQEIPEMPDTGGGSLGHCATRLSVA